MPTIKPILKQVPEKPVKYLRELPEFDRGFNFNSDERGLLISVNNDNDAVLSFLVQYIGSKSTFKTYSKEIERFLLWLEYKEIAISDFMPVHYTEFMDFIINPKPVKLWVGPRASKFLRSGKLNPKWRVFSGTYDKDLLTKKSKLVSYGLKPTSVALARAVVGALFEYLANSSYLIKNPVAISKFKNKGNSDVVIKKRVKDRVIRPKLIEFVLNVLQKKKQAATNPKDVFYPIRAQFVISMFINTGLRISELAVETMSNIKTSQLNINITYMEVLGKGGKIREIQLNENDKTIIKEFREKLGLGYTLPSKLETTPLVPQININKPIGPTQLHNIVKDTFEYAAKVLSFGIMSIDVDSQAQAIIDSDLSTLQAVSAHWLRHSHATWYQSKNQNIKDTKERLGHSDVNTTMIYVHVSDGVNVIDSEDSKRVDEIYKQILNDL